MKYRDEHTSDHRPSRDELAGLTETNNTDTVNRLIKSLNDQPKNLLINGSTNELKNERLHE